MHLTLNTFYRALLPFCFEKPKYESYFTTQNIQANTALQYPIFQPCTRILFGQIAHLRICRMSNKEMVSRIERRTPSFSTIGTKTSTLGRFRSSRTSSRRDADGRSLGRCVRGGGR